jgi:hypothetical protein
MGGNANGHELDAGVSWSRHHNAKGLPTWTDSTTGTDGGDPARRFTKEKGVVLDGNGKTITDRKVLNRLQPNY